MQWKKLSRLRAISNKGYKLYKPALQDYYNVHLLDGTWLGVIYDKGDIQGFLNCGSFQALQRQQFLF